MSLKYRFLIGCIPVADPRMQIVNEVALELARRGNQVVMVVDKDYEMLNEENIILYKRPAPRSTTTFQDVRFMMELIDQYQPDCVISEGFASSRVVMLAGRLKRVPFLMNWYHTMQSQLITNMPQWRQRIPLLASWNARRLLHVITHPHLITCSQAASQELQAQLNIPTSKTFVVRYLIHDPVEEEGLELTDHYDPHHFMMVGRLSLDKGPDVLVRAVALLKPKYPHICVEFVGKGVLKKTLVNLARELGVEDNCVFVGHVKHDEIYRRMSGVCATILPSRSEALGIVSLESMSVGTPVIASDVGGIPEVIRNGVEGFLFRTEDHEELAQHMETLMTRPELRAEFSRNARETFLKQFTVEQNIHYVAERLERMVAKELTSTGEQYNSA